MDYEVLNFFLRVWSFVGFLSVLAGLSFIGWAFDRSLREIIDFFRNKKVDKANNK